MIYIHYLWYVLRHKWFVMLECWKRGLIWRGIVHDLSKFRPSEFIPYARHFHGNINRGRDGTGYYKPTGTGDPAFDHAWFLHQKRNDHHWQWWVYPGENGTIVLAMHSPAMIEMLCDWIGAGRAQGTPRVDVWYEANNHKMRLHQGTRDWLNVEVMKLRRE